jgi:hypothetical protein
MLPKNSFTQLVALVVVIFSAVGLTTASIVAPIATNAIAAPVKGKTLTKVKDITRQLCQIGGCWSIVERVTEYFSTYQDVPESSNTCSGKGCSTIRSGGSEVKIGETRTIISKVRIR